MDKWLLKKPEILVFYLFVFSALILVQCGDDFQPNGLLPTIEHAVQGRVVDKSQNPINGAIVRVKTTNISTFSELDGFFLFQDLDPSQPVTLTAWAPGYFIGGGESYYPGTKDIVITLSPHHTADNSDYQWLSALETTGGSGENQACAECHSRAETEVEWDLPVDEWLQDAHSQSAVNPRFLSMYAGTDLLGHQSPLTRFAYNVDYGQFPLPPDDDQPYFGPGYKLDFPGIAGNCAACHIPLASIDDPYGTDPAQISGEATEGVSCDFCHKISDINLDPDSALPRDNMPGVLSYDYLRPPEGHQFFAGPYDDVAPGEDVYLSLQDESQICAGCHYGIFWDTTIYNSYGEWLESPYSSPETGQTCQDCHMPPSGAPIIALPEEGGETRDPGTIYSHRMQGASDESLLQNALTMVVKTENLGDDIIVEVTLTNDQTGHHIPTDSPLRHMLILVEVVDSDGLRLPLKEGLTLPDWAGIGDPREGYYAGLPGKAYAKILKELWTEISPSGAYWNPTIILSDNRLAAFTSDTTRYVFTAPNESPINVHVRLLYRRAFIDLMDQKKWDVPDILMEDFTVTSQPSP